jgi:hypothetical protein
VVADVDCVSADRVICLEWYGEGPPPASRWRRELRGSLSKEENDSIDIMLKRILGPKASREQPAETERRGPDLNELGYSDEDLFYILFGVPDERIWRVVEARARRTLFCRGHGGRADTERQGHTCHGTNPRIWISLSLVVTAGGA